MSISILRRFCPFLPHHLDAEFNVLTAEAKIASWGEGGRAGLVEAGFVVSVKGNPTIRDE
jgi:hypothetical protein